MVNVKSISIESKMTEPSLCLDSVSKHWLISTNPIFKPVRASIHPKDVISVWVGGVRDPDLLHRPHTCSVYCRWCKE